MKNSILKSCFVLVLFITSLAFGQCPPANSNSGAGFLDTLVITTQEQLNAFLNYPNCTNYPHHIIIVGNVNTSNIHDLSPLQNLVEIGGNLEIGNNHLLQNLNGLQNFTHIGGGLRIFMAPSIENPQLNSLEALSNLEEIETYLALENLPFVTNLDAFSSISHLKQALIISGNPLLNNINGVSQLENLSEMGQGLIIENNTSLSAINFPSLYIANDFTNISILGNNALSSIQFPLIQSVFNLKILNNASLTQFNAPQLWKIGQWTTYPFNVVSQGGLQINNNTSLQNLNGLSGLLNVASVEINNNMILNNINGLSNILYETLLDYSTAAIKIQNNPELTQCHIDSFCDLLDYDATESTVYMIIENNGIGCGSKIAVYNQCLGTNECPQQDFVFNTQEEVDQFIIDYPFCTEINGNLIIDGNGVGITDLSSFFQITAIHGDLEITNSSIASLEGFNQLLNINGDLILEENSNLIDLNHFTSLANISGNLTISFNPVLNNIDVLSDVNFTNLQNLTLHNNSNLTECSIMPICNYLQNNGLATVHTNAHGCNSVMQVTTICVNGGICPNVVELVFNSQQSLIDYQNSFPFCRDFIGNITISGQTISDLSPLSGIETLTGNLVIVNNPNLNGLSGLSNLSVISGELYIQDNPLLEDLDVIQNIDLSNVTMLAIQNNELLSFCHYSNICEYLLYEIGNYSIVNNSDTCETDLDVKDACGSVLCPQGNININSQADLNQFAINYPFCTTIHGNLFIQFGNITDLSPLQNITTITGRLLIRLTSLTNLNGLNNLTYIGGDCSIITNPLLINLQGLESLEYVNGHFDLEYNAGLNNIDALVNLEQVGGYFRVRGSGLLTSISGFNALTAIGHTLWISNNNTLEIVDGFTSLQAVGFAIDINNNPELNSIEGLSNINITTALFIYNNPNLSFCSLPNICHRLSTIQPQLVGFISNNGNDCNSINSILNVCPTIWNGNQWSLNVPNLNKDAVVAGDFSSTNNLEVKNLKVKQGANLVVNSGHTLTVSGSLTNENNEDYFVLENNAHLIQLSDVQNTASITIKRNALLKRLDVPFWTSPVEPQIIKDFSPETLNNRFFSYNETTNNWEVIPNVNNYEMLPTVGYGIRAPNNHPVEATIWTGVFKGVPNNGDFIVPVSSNHPTARFNLIGNPFPSAMNLRDFYDSNEALIENKFYFMEHTLPTPSPAGQTNYGVLTISPNNPQDNVYIPASIPAFSEEEMVNFAQNEVVQIGQGFFVKVKEQNLQGSLVFQNSMRSVQNGSFFRLNTTSAESDMFKLRLIGPTAYENTLAIGYYDYASNGLDVMDTQGLGSSFYSLLENKKLVVQGLSAPFNASSIIPIGLNAAQIGQYSIGMKEQKGIFSESVHVFIHDLLLEQYHNLTLSDYTFEVSEIGNLNQRFEVLYFTTLSSDDFSETNENIVVWSDVTSINIKSLGNETIRKVILYDISGRKIYSEKLENPGLYHHISDLSASKEIYIVVATLEIGKTEIVKIIH
uniref:hypothetical protein n=1 Tax=Flavobacterium sp. TaxID=239 RepID=UPI0040492C95